MKLVMPLDASHCAVGIPSRGERCEYAPPGMTIIAAPLALPVGGRNTVRVGISTAEFSSCCSGARPDHRRRICKSSSCPGGVARITGSFPSTVKNGDAVLICLGVRGTRANGTFVITGASDVEDAARPCNARRIIGSASKVRISVRGIDVRLLGFTSRHASTCSSNTVRTRRGHDRRACRSRWDGNGAFQSCSADVVGSKQ